MTTIAYRAGRIAADTQVSSGPVFDCTAIKVARNDQGDLAGAAGGAVFAQQFLAWFIAGEEGELPKFTEQSEAFIVRAADQTKFEYWDDAGKGVFFASYCSIGSGKRLALGAMACGAGAEQSVLCASKHDIYTNDALTVLTHAG